MTLRIDSAGSDYPLTAGERSRHPEHDLLQLPPLLPATQLRSEGSWGKNVYIYQRKTELGFFFCLFSKIAVGGALTLQVLLMCTVISLGGFPANCPHHPSLPQTHTSKHSQRPYLQNLLFISQENHRRGNAAAGRPLLCVWIFWSSSKMKSMWWKWPDINKPSGHKPIQQIPCDLCLHSVLCSFFKDF